MPHEAPSPKRVAVSYFAPFLSPGGFSSEAWSFALGLAQLREVDLELIHHGDTFDDSYVATLPSDHRALTSRFKRDFGAHRVVVCHSSPDAMSLPEPKWATPPALQCPPPYQHGPVVARVMYETDTLPSGWRERLAAADEVWVPTQFHMQVFEKGGVERIAVIGESVDTEAFSPSVGALLSAQQVQSHTVFETQPAAAEGTRCRIISSGKWEERKGFEALIRSFRSAFASDPNRAELLILSRPFHDNSTWSERVEPLLGAARQGARVAVLEELPPRLLPGFYKSGDAFALATKGEGWGRPFAEAMAMERVVVATDFSGQTEFMRDGENALLARCSLVDRGDGHRWCQVDEAHLAQLLASVCDESQAERMRQIAKAARATMVNSYSIDALAKQIYERLLVVKRRS